MGEFSDRSTGGQVPRGYCDRDLPEMFKAGWRKKDAKRHAVRTAQLAVPGSWREWRGVYGWLSSRRIIHRPGKRQLRFMVVLSLGNISAFLPNGLQLDQILMREEMDNRGFCFS